MVFAEPPRYRQQYQQQYYFARQQEEPAPYPASGWKPAGPAFNLPQKQSQQQYGAPNAPQQQYGAPDASRKQYEAPSAPRQQYGTPDVPQKQYGGPSAPEQQFGDPRREYGIPEESTTTETPNTTEEEEVSTVQGITESEVSKALIIFCESWLIKVLWNSKWYEESRLPTKFLS